MAQAPDVTVLINNAGIAVESDTLLALPDEEVRKVMETNFFGPVALTKAFAPVLAASGTSAVLNIHSALSWIALTGAYSADHPRSVVTQDGSAFYVSGNGTGKSS